MLRRVAASIALGRGLPEPVEDFIEDDPIDRDYREASRRRVLAPNEDGALGQLSLDLGADPPPQLEIVEDPDFSHLIWHADYQVPAFMTNYTGDFAAMLKNHVQTIVSHFQGRVVSWDVVNEALADDGQPTVNNILRSTIFSQRMGQDFIDQSFINARAVDPQADLFYNDYNIEAGGQKTANLLTLIDGMRARGVPITGVGFQMHVTIDWPSITAIESSLKAVADRGLKVKISEMDVSMKSAYTSFTADAALRQQQRYHDIIAAYLRAVPAAQRAGITVWGVWDADSWINQPGSPDWPLLFDGNFQAKPALQGFKDALLGN